MRLCDWQRDLQQVVISGDDVASLTLRQDPIPRQTALGINRNAYIQRLIEALRCNHPALHQLLGDRDFDCAAEGFIAAHPPRHASIRWFGEGLDDYLRQTAPFNSCPAMAELARFEWALRHCIDAGDARRLNAEQLQALDPGQWHSLHLPLHPSLTLLALEWNTPAIWQALTDDRDPPDPASVLQGWLVYRQADGLMTAWRSADAVEFAALQVLREGADLGSLCEQIVTTLADVQLGLARVVELLQVWVAQGLLLMPLDQATTVEE